MEFIKHKTVIVIFLIILLGLTLRFYGLDQKSLWHDEVVNLNRVVWLSFVDIIFSKPYHANPPLYFLLLKLWTMLFGTLHFAIRSLSAIFGVISLYFIYRVGELSFGKRVGILSALLLSISPLHLFYSQDATCYSLFVLLCLIVVFIILKLEITKRKALWSFYLFMAFFGLLMTHYYSIFFLLSIDAFFLLNYRRYSGLVKKLFIAQLIISLFFIPFFIHVLKDLFSQGFIAISWIEKMPMREAFTEMVETFSYGGVHYGGRDIKILEKNLIIPSLLDYIYLFCISFGLYISFKIKNLQISISRDKEFLLLFWLFGGIIISLIFSWFFFPIFVPRYIIYSLPAWYILIAKGLSNIKPRFLKNSLIIIIIILNIFSVTYYYRNELKAPWKKITQYLQERGFNYRDLIVFVPNFEKKVLSFNANSSGKDNKLYRTKTISWCEFKNILGNPLSKEIKPVSNSIAIYKKQRIFLILGRWAGTKYKPLTKLSLSNQDYYFEDCTDYPFELRDIFNNSFNKVNEHYFDANGDKYAIKGNFRTDIIWQSNGIYVGEFILNN